jgi:hypothetical protein
MSDAFTKAVDEFSLDDWIDGARLPEKSVTVYGRADLVDAQGSDDGDERLVGSPVSRLAAAIEACEKDMKASALTFRFRAILDADVEAAKRAHPGDEEARTYAMLSKQSVHPQVSEQQWPKIRERIGEGQFNALLNAAAEASFERQIPVPFSLAASAARSTQDS